MLFLEFVVGFALRSGSVLRTLPEGECEAEPPTHMSIRSVHVVACIAFVHSACHVPVAMLAQAKS